MRWDILNTLTTTVRFTVQERQAAMRHRKITFEGKFEPVKWACRAPLPSGKLCPRRDRVKVRISAY